MSACEGASATSTKATLQPCAAKQRTNAAPMPEPPPATAEALGFTGFDFLVVDTEHTPVDVPQMIEILRAIAGTPAQAIVRPPWNDMVMLKRVLDAGAQSLLLPFVQNEDEAKRAVAF